MKLFFLTATLAALLSAPASGDIIASDGFGDGDRNNDGAAEAAATDASDTGLIFVRSSGSKSNDSPAVTVIDDANGIGDGNALSVNGNGSKSTRRMLAAFDAVTLGAADEFISVSFDARHHGAAPVADRKFRFGLFNEGAKKTVNDFDGNSTNDTHADDMGYYVGLDSGAGDGTTADIRLEAPADPDFDGSPLGGSDGESFGASTDDATASLTETAKRYKLTITYISADDLNFRLDVDGTNVIDRSLSASSGDLDVVNTLTFDAFLFGQNGAELDYLLDNVTVESNVRDEPA